MSNIKIDVDSIIENRLGNLKKLHEQFPENANPFLEAISIEVSRHSSLTRSLTSRLGGSLAGIARDLAEYTYGTDLVPSHVVCEGLDFDPEDQTAHRVDTLVYTHFDEATLITEAQRLIKFAKKDPSQQIGTGKFQTEYVKSMNILKAANKIEPWSLQVDLFVNEPGIGFCELESGGNLDTSNVTAQPLKLVKAGLASGSEVLGLHFCLAYANRGENKPVQSALTGFFRLSGNSETGDGLYIGREWWEIVLPEGFTYDQFMQSYKEIVDKLDIVGS
jgi:hypothetical protein